MKERDNKRTRNHRRWREKNRARDKRENLIGVDTGFTDKKGKPIRTGDRVSIGDSVDIVLLTRVPMAKWITFSAATPAR